MPQSTHLALPLIDAAQAQKHVTHNEALAMMDALAHLSVAARVTAPPASPVEGDRVLVGSGATGAFAGKDGQIAAFLAGAWTFLAPQAGWRAYVEAESLLLLHNGAGWVDVGAAIQELQNLARLGVGTTADAANPLSAKINAALFAAKTIAEGGSGDLRLTLNKEDATKTVSQLYQSNYSGRAETGLTGVDNFRVKVSANGTLWRESIVVDRTTGAVSFPSGGPTRVLTFTSSGAYAPAPGMRFVDVVLVGAGGGAGAGARGASGGARSGGGGGGGGGVARGRFTAAQVGASQSIMIGAGGLGGPAQTIDGAAGANGAAGGNTRFGNLLVAGGGGAGSGGGLAVGSGGGSGGLSLAGANASGATGGAAIGPGTSAGGSAAVGGAGFVFGNGGGGAGSPATGGSGTQGGTALHAPSGGGSGGGISPGAALFPGGGGGLVVYNGAPAQAAAGAAGAAGGAGPTWALGAGPLDMPGAGGAGGGSSLTAPGAGGVGGFPGGGGGGGGASQNGANSGAGGAGAGGFAIVIEYF